MSRPKKSKAVLIVSILAVLVTLLAVLCFLVKPLVIAPQQEAVRKANAEMKAEVEKRNQDIMQQYLLDKSEWEQKTKQPTQPNWPEAPKTGWFLADLSDIPLENQNPQPATRAELMYNGMLLVNPWHKRPDDFNESDQNIVSVAGVGKLQANDNNVRIHANALNALIAAEQGAKDAGYTHYMVSEGLRTFAKQQELFDKEYKSLESKYGSEEAAKEATKKKVNEAGCSEFNTALTFTLRLYDRSDPDVGTPKYSTTPEARWMNENCWKYGLVFRFPLNSWPLETSTDKSFKTGVSVQLNAYRYVGKGNAAIMHYLDYTLEEYIEYLAEHSHIALYVDGEPKYEVYRQYVGDANEFNVQLTGNLPYESSLDNMGYIITVFTHNEIKDDESPAAVTVDAGETAPEAADDGAAEAEPEGVVEDADDQETNAEA